MLSIYLLGGFSVKRTRKVRFTSFTSLVGTNHWCYLRLFVFESTPGFLMVFRRVAWCLALENALTNSVPIPFKKGSRDTGIKTVLSIHWKPKSIWTTVSFCWILVLWCCSGANISTASTWNIESRIYMQEITNDVLEILQSSLPIMSLTIWQPLLFY